MIIELLTWVKKIRMAIVIYHALIRLTYVNEWTTNQSVAFRQWVSSGAVIAMVGVTPLSAVAVATNLSMGHSW